jgi:hypothetical protein
VVYAVVTIEWFESIIFKNTARYASGSKFGVLEEYGTVSGNLRAVALVTDNSKLF